MTKKLPRLARLELQILELLWSRGRASVREIQEGFPEPRPAYTTVQTTVYRLEAKRAVRRTRTIGNAHIFEPLVARDLARTRLLDTILAFFGGRAPGPGLPGPSRMAPPRPVARRVDQVSRPVRGLGGGRQQAPAPLRSIVASPAARDFNAPFAALWVNPTTLVAEAAQPQWGAWVLFGVSLCGFAVITLRRARQWREARAAVHASTPFDGAVVPHGIEGRTAHTVLEPGVVGVWRPVILLPAGIDRYLTADRAGHRSRIGRLNLEGAPVRAVMATVFPVQRVVGWPDGLDERYTISAVMPDGASMGAQQVAIDSRAASARSLAQDARERMLRVADPLSKA